MNSMPLDKGRVNQKIKTRRRILSAAENLISKKEKITLEDVAREAGVGRATVYRYFPNIDLLFTEASLDVHFLSPQELYEQVKDKDMLEQIIHVQNYYNAMSQEHESIFRRYLSTALTVTPDPEKKIRGARRVESMNLILEKFQDRFSDTDRENIKNIATVLMGIESMVVTKDVCGLDNPGSSAVLQWAIEKIFAGLDAHKD